MISGTAKIVSRHSEVDQLIEIYYRLTKGMNAKKLCGLVSRHFSGVSQKRIQLFIHNQRQAQSVRPKFLNKAPLMPVIAQHCNQLDLIDLSDMPVEVDPDGLTYKYVLCIMDVIRRYIGITIKLLHF